MSDVFLPTENGLLYGDTGERKNALSLVTYGHSWLVVTGLQN